MNYSRWKFFLFWENNLPFLPFHGVQGWLWHTAIAAGGLGPQKPEGSRCSEMHSQPYLRRFFLVCNAVWPEPNYFFSWNQSTIIFFKEFQGTIIFFKEYQGTIIFFNSIHGPPPGYVMVNALVRMSVYMSPFKYDHPQVCPPLNSSVMAYESE